MSIKSLIEKLEKIVNEGEDLSPVGKPKPDCELVGQDGNAFAIMGRVRKALSRAGYTPEEIEQYRKDATSGDYNHLLSVTMDWVNDIGEDDYEEDDYDESKKNEKSEIGDDEHNFTPFLKDCFARLGLKKDVDYTVTSNGKLITFNTPEDFDKAIKHLKSKGLNLRTENKSIVLESKEMDYTDATGYKKLTDTQNLTGKRVKVKTSNAYGSVGTILYYNDENDYVIVRMAGNKNISVSIKDVEVLNPNVDPKKSDKTKEFVKNMGLDKAKDQDATRKKDDK